MLGNARALVVRFADAADIRAQGGELAENVLIAALDQVDVFDLRRAPCAEPGGHHGCAGAQVVRPDGSALQERHALDDRGLALYLDGGAHAQKLLHIAEAVVPDALGDDAGALADREQRCELRLHIGGEAGVRHGLDVAFRQSAGRADADAFVVFLDLRAAFDQLRGDGFQMLRDDVADHDVAARRRRHDHIGAGLDLVGHDGIVAAVHMLDAADLDRVRTGAAHVRAHQVQKVRQVDDVRLLRRIFDDRQPLRPDGGEHDVHGRADADHVEIDRAAHQRVRGRGDHGVLCPDPRAERLKALDVLVDGTDAEIAAAGHGNFRLAGPAQQSADKIIGGAHLLRHRVGDDVGSERGRVDLEGVRVQHADLCTEAPHDLEHQANVPDVGHVLDAADPFRQQRGGDQRDSGIFRAADIDGAVKLFPAGDNEFIQKIALPN